METIVYNQKGEETGKTKLPEGLFGLPWNADLVHQVVVSMQSTARRGTAHTKNRGEVSGTGKKPWQQKGTGQARHGSRRSPIWVGGGVAHGPRTEKNYDRKVNRKMKDKALLTILSSKFKNGEITFVDAIKLSDVKTKSAIETLTNFDKIPSLKGFMRKTNALAIFVPEKTPEIYRPFKNIGNIVLEDVRSINPVSLLSSKRVLFVGPEAIVQALNSKSRTATTADSTDAPVKKAVASKKAPKAKVAKATPKKK